MTVDGACFPAREEHHRTGDLLRCSRLPMGEWRRKSASLRAESGFRVMGVSVGPGPTALTVMPCIAHSEASDFVSATTPPLAETYTARFGPEVTTSCDATLTMRP